MVRCQRVLPESPHISPLEDRQLWNEFLLHVLLSSRENRLHHLAMHVGKPKPAALMEVRQAFVIHAQ